MAATHGSRDPRATALAWLWSRPPSPKVGDRVDLETLDKWRQGLLSPERSGQVKRQLSEDPRLMRMLEELVAADDLLQQWGAEEEATARGPGVRARLRQFGSEALTRLIDPVWAGGLIAAAASLLVLVMFAPYFTEPALDRELDSVYAALDAPPEELSLPWGPKIAIRGDPGTDPGVDATESGRLAKHAFQAGMVGGLEQLTARYPALDLNPRDRLHKELPACAEEDKVCLELVELAGTTGSWALAVYLQCQGAPAFDQPRAIGLLPDLQAAWRELPVVHPLGDQVNAIVVDQNPCGSVERMLRSWGRS